MIKFMITLIARTEKMIKMYFTVMGITMSVMMRGVRVAPFNVETSCDSAPGSIEMVAAAAAAEAAVSTHLDD